ncbi:MAG: flotillin family protein [Saprospiraceae bacterium]
MGDYVLYVTIGIIVILTLGIFAWLASMYKKVPQGKMLVRTGIGGLTISNNGMIVLPIFHKLEIMDISVKKLEIERLNENGLICEDNIRADIKVAFFVRVSPDHKNVMKVAQTIGCERASDVTTLNTLFEAKFSEALKTVGKKTLFEDLYSKRVEFRKAIEEVINGDDDTDDLNGYQLDNIAIDYLEQTDLKFLKPDNVLDSQGIRIITERTADQNKKTNLIRREEEKTITEQNVEAKEAILELNRQLAEKEARQQREIANINAREQAEIDKVNEEERLKSQQAKVRTEEELGILEANKERQIIVAIKNKERTEAVEHERVDKDRQLEINEKERIVTLAQIEKEKAIEEERKRIQEIISERVAVDKKVAQEEEKIKDLKALADAERSKNVALISASEKGESLIITTTKRAEADKLAAEVNAQKMMIDAKAKQEAASKEAEARKIHAEALAAEEATIGLAEAQVIEAKAQAKEKDGSVEAIVLEKTLAAEAKGIELKAEAKRKEGLAEAEVLRQKGNIEAEVLEKQVLAEAKGIEQKGLAEALSVEKLGLAEAEIMHQKVLAEAKGIEEKGLAEAKSVAEKAKAMQELNEVGKEHEEFKLRLQQQTEIQLAKIGIQQHIAEAQAKIMAEAFKSANIEIVGGEQQFFDSVMNAMSQSKFVDTLVDNSDNLTALKSAMLGDGESNGDLMQRIKGFITKTGMTSDDVRNLTMSNLLMQLSQKANDEDKSVISTLMNTVKAIGIGGKNAGDLL